MRPTSGLGHPSPRCLPGSKSSWGPCTWPTLTPRPVASELAPLPFPCPGSCQHPLGGHAEHQGCGHPRPPCRTPHALPAGPGTAGAQTLGSPSGKGRCSPGLQHPECIALILRVPSLPQSCLGQTQVRAAGARAGLRGAGGACRPPAPWGSFLWVTLLQQEASKDSGSACSVVKNVVHHTIEKRALLGKPPIRHAQHRGQQGDGSFPTPQASKVMMGHPPAPGQQGEGTPSCPRPAR